MITAAIPVVSSQKPIHNCQKRWKIFSIRWRHMRRQLSIPPLRQLRRTPIKVTEGLRKIKGYHRIHYATHAPFERSHRKNISVIKEGALEMLLNSKLSDTAHKILWAEDVHT